MIPLCVDVTGIVVGAEVEVKVCGADCPESCTSCWDDAVVTQVNKSPAGDVTYDVCIDGKMHAKGYPTSRMSPPPAANPWETLQAVRCNIFVHDLPLAQQISIASYGMQITCNWKTTLESTLKLHCNSLTHVRCNFNVITSSCWLSFSHSPHV